MSDQDITYVFRDDKTYAIRHGKVIVSHADPAEVERQVLAWMDSEGGLDYPPESGGNMDPESHGVDPRLHDDPTHPYYDPPCPGCGRREGAFDGQSCAACGYAENGQHGHGMEENFPSDQPSPGMEMGGEAGPYMAKVVTPNGLKGTVLGKVAGIWGDEVTVRLENGRIVKLPTGTVLRSQKQASAPRVTPIERLESRLSSTPDGTRQSLVSRHDEVTRIVKDAADLLREGVSYADSVRLDQIAVTAHNEGLEIVEAIEHLDAAERIEAPRSFTITAANRTAGVSREDASWLDHTLDEMIKEAEATDFTKLMDEGPEAFAAELPDVALADTGVTRQMASSFIGEKTAGIDRQIAEPYMTTFLSRVEECRRAELAGRKQTTHKEAAATEDKYKDLPDESLFL